MCRINAFGRGCIRLEWFDSVLRTRLRGYRTHCRAAEGSSSQTKRREGRGARPAVSQRPLRSLAALQRPEPSATEQ